MAQHQSDGGADQLFPMVYEELRRIASRSLRTERNGHTLQTTALVHEAYLRLAGLSKATSRGRDQFLGLAAVAMRRILVDHARKRRAAKREGTWTRVRLHESLTSSDDQGARILELNMALEELSGVDPRAARIVELRYFGGLTENETASVMGMSERSVRNEWAHARARLRIFLERGNV